jgi:hypothetical protein
VKILVQLGAGGTNGVVRASSELTTVFVDAVEEVVLEAIV